MASIKTKFRASTVEGKEGVIYYQVIHERATRQISTSYRIFCDEWNEKLSQISITNHHGEERHSYLIALQQQIKLDNKRLSYIITSLSGRGAFTSDDITHSFEKQLKGITLFNFMQGIISRLKELRKERTYETYKTTLNSFMRFRRGEDLLLTDLSSDIIMDYEAYLKTQGITNNSVSFYMRILRAVYNRAVEDKLVEQRFPFKKVYTGVDKTVKRALPLKYVRRIKELNLITHPDLVFARDMFMLSFYTRGMSFVDMAYLRTKDLTNGVVSYRRRKTGQQLHVKWERCMQEILERHPSSDTDYLLPIIRNKSKDSRSQYRSSLCSVNNKLKKIGELAGIPTPLTHYVARHSWASIARSRNIPISVISEGMGHDSEATTRIYLASLDCSVVDKANNLILKLL